MRSGARIVVKLHRGDGKKTKNSFTTKKESTSRREYSDVYIFIAEKEIEKQFSYRNYIRPQKILVLYFVTFSRTE